MCNSGARGYVGSSNPGITMCAWKLHHSDEQARALHVFCPCSGIPIHGRPAQSLQHFTVRGVASPMKMA
jgi:hypothetical protein